MLGNPTDDFPLDFTRDTITAIYDQVRGQPYLTQFIGYYLVNRYNHLLFDQQQEQPRQFNPFNSMGYPMENLTVVTGLLDNLRNY